MDMYYEIELQLPPLIQKARASKSNNHNWTATMATSSQNCSASSGALEGLDLSADTYLQS